MLNWNLGLTTKLAYAMSTILILFLSSAFISLANADEAGVSPTAPPEALGSFGNSEGSPPVDYGHARFQKRWDKLKTYQDDYAERWAWRKSRYRLWEEYAGWIRDHNYYGDYGAGGYGTEQVSPYRYTPYPLRPITIISIVEKIVALF